MSSPALLFNSLLLAASLFAAPAAVAGDGPPSVRWASLPADEVAPEAGTPTLAPFAHVVFCKTYPGDCRTDGQGRGPVRQTPALAALLKQVNLQVNRAIRPTAEGSGPLDDVWVLSPRKGDCDDYAVTKRRELIRAGLPVSALRLMVVRTRAGEGHAVLAVRTDRGDVVLDNLTDQILDWRRTGLTLVKYQSADDPRRWYRPPGGRMASLE